jgi:hypothetical protein
MRSFRINDKFSTSGQAILCKQKMIVVSTMILHNYIRKHISGDVDFEQVERDEDYEPTILKRYNKNM